MRFILAILLLVLCASTDAVPMILSGKTAAAGKIASGYKKPIYIYTIGDSTCDSLVVSEMYDPAGVGWACSQSAMAACAAQTSPAGYTWRGGKTCVCRDDSDSLRNLLYLNPPPGIKILPDYPIPPYKTVPQRTFFAYAGGTIARWLGNAGVYCQQDTIYQLYDSYIANSQKLFSCITTASPKPDYVLIISAGWNDIHAPLSKPNEKVHPPESTTWAEYYPSDDSAETWQTTGGVWKIDAKAKEFFQALIDAGIGIIYVSEYPCSRGYPEGGGLNGVLSESGAGVFHNFTYPDQLTVGDINALYEYFTQQWKVWLEARGQYFFDFLHYLTEYYGSQDVMERAIFADPAGKDACHMNAAGHKLMYEYVYNKLQETVIRDNQK